GTRARLPGISVCGKTGTAQVASAGLVKAMEGSHAAADFANNAWFVGFAPREHPEIVVVALVQGGGESTVAVPVVRDVLKAYFDKKGRRFQPLPSLAGSFAPQPQPVAFLRPAALDRTR
ncbi:MAG TPA: penicillin-binding transpeptidase domain-containing protein, partial [Bryobacteraceae bacterium]|nr:penicillin-binding transpeptidase domain-containing protein [Bryobacteraceae bacterium]